MYQTLEKIMSNILPKVHAIPMTLQTLNTEAFYPRKDDQLLSGFLQVTRGTALLLDETALEEGTLNEQGKYLGFESSFSLSTKATH